MPFSFPLRAKEVQMMASYPCQLAHECGEGCNVSVLEASHIGQNDVDILLADTCTAEGLTRVDVKKGNRDLSVHSDSEGVVLALGSHD
eukprot:1866201-Amphidinium_carterae.1